MFWEPTMAKKCEILDPNPQNELDNKKKKKLMKTLFNCSDKM